MRFFVLKKVQTLITTILFQAALNIFLFWSNRKKNSDDFYLIVLMSLFLIHTAFKYLLWLIAPDYNTFHKIQGCFSLLYGPYLLFYLNRVLGHPTKNTEKRYHFIPFVLALFFNIRIVVEVLVFKNDLHLEYFHQIMTLIVLIPMSFYACFILNRLRQIQKTPDVILGYKLKIVKVIAAFLLLPGLLFLLNKIGAFPVVIDRRIWYSGMILMMAAVLNYRFKVSGVYKQDLPESELPEPKKYQNSSLSMEKLQTIVLSVTKLMSERKPYLDTDFSLDDLAEMTSIPKHHITEVLNLSLQINFYKFTNQFRVEEAKRLIREMTAGQNLIEIGLLSGFKSKSTFNKYFKEITGQSPSEYSKLIGFVPVRN